MARKNAKQPPDAAKPVASPATKERVTFQLSVALIEKARDEVYFTPGLTMARLMEEALTAQLQRLENKRGKPYPSRGGVAIRTGRPVKAG